MTSDLPTHEAIGFVEPAGQDIPLGYVAVFADEVGTSTECFAWRPYLLPPAAVNGHGLERFHLYSAATCLLMPAWIYHLWHLGLRRLTWLGRTVDYIGLGAGGHCPRFPDRYRLVVTTLALAGMKGLAPYISPGQEIPLLARGEAEWLKKREHYLAQRQIWKPKRLKKPKPVRLT